MSTQRTLGDLTPSTIVWYSLKSGAACPFILLEQDDFNRTQIVARDNIFGSYMMNPVNSADIYEGSSMDERLTRLDSIDYSNVAAYNSKTTYTLGNMCKSSNMWFTYINETDGAGHAPPSTMTSNDYWELTSLTGKAFLPQFFDEYFIDKLRDKEIYNYHFTDAENVPLNRKCYLLSYANVASGTAPEGDVSYRNIICAAMQATTDHGSTIKFYSPEMSGTGNGVYWWLRSPASASAFSIVYNNGNLSSYAASGSCAARPAFSLASSTLVTPAEDVGEDGKIWILANDEKPYKEIDVYIDMGECINKPKSAKIDFTQIDCYEFNIQICNNYKDSTPFWEEINTDYTIDFTNDIKETTNWEIGLHITCKTLGSGHISEPAIVVTY